MTWLNPPTPSLKSPPAQECSATESSPPSRQSASEPLLWVVVSGTPVQRPRGWRHWKSRKAAARFFGTMCEPSSPGGADEWNRWISSVEATRVSRSQSLAASLGRRILATFGRKCVESIRRLSRSSCSSRTWTAMCGRDSSPLSEISKRTATVLRGECTARRKLGRRISGSGCLSWASWRSPSTAEPGILIENIVGGGDHRAYHKETGRLVQTGLYQQIQAWGTPTALNATGTRHSGPNRNPGETLVDHRQNWPTTTSRDWKVGDIPNRVGSEALTSSAESFPCSRPTEPTTPPGLTSLLKVWTPPSTPRLSPGFQWWLMGWPHPRIFFDSEETGSSRSPQHGHSCHCSRCCAWREWKGRLISGLYSIVRSMTEDIRRRTPAGRSGAASVSLLERRGRCAASKKRG